MKDLPSLVKGLSDGMADAEWGNQSGNWGFADKDPDGGTTFETMDADASYPHNASPSTIGHDHYKRPRGGTNG